MSIPKTIHYCWFGNKAKPQVVVDCINRWKNILPDYNIIEWNERNTNLKHPFVRRAYRQKKWAFVSDYVRFSMLYKFGGIYLDTDMLMVKSLDEFLDNKCFLGAEDENYINAGIIGTEKKHYFIKQCLIKYEDIKMKNETDWSQVTVPKIITKVFRECYNFNSLFTDKIEIQNIVIYPPSYFYPLSLKDRKDIFNYKDYLTSDSHAVHLWNASWIEPNEFQYIRNKKYYSGLKKITNNIISNRKISFFYVRKILSALKESITPK
jgi:mannosyltransferase OCH1-like enzyme